MATSPKLDADLQGVPIDQRKYHGMVGSLMYLTASRPDIHHVVCICARYQKSIDERALHKREYDSRVNERQLQTKEGKVNTCKALDASLVVTKSSGIEFEEQNTSSSLGNDADADDADIKHVYYEKPMAE
ncbi:hypothetical protein Tco_1261969, partial [Tanacetum coccineum]